jgi:Tol biopolymer transport system component
MRLRWTVLLALLICALSLASCSSTSTSAPIYPTPVITGLFPSSITAGSQTFTVFISGTGFISNPQSQVFWNGSMRTSVLNNTTQQLAVTIMASDVATAGVGAVTVSNPEPGGPSLASSFIINPVQNGTPFIASLSPTSVSPGSGTFVLTVNGSGYVAPVVVNGVTQIAGSTVAWNGAPLTTTFVGSTQLTASVPGSNISSPGFASISVYNTTPGDTQLYSPSVDFNYTTSGSAFPQVASVSATSGAADGASAAPAMSTDGRYLAFFSTAKNIVAHGAHGNIFVRDTCMATSGCIAKTAAVDLAPDGSAPNAAAGNQVAMSADGRFVVFESKATNLVSGLRNSSESSAGAMNLFVRDLCKGANAPSGCTTQTYAVSLDASGELASGGDSGFASISADGRFIAFASSAANLVAGQTGAGSQVFVRDTCAGPTAAKSCVARTEQTAIAAKYSASGSEGETPSISADGRYVAFVVFGTNSFSAPYQVLLHDSCAGSSVPASCIPSTTEISITSTGQPGNAQSSAPAVSGDGRFVVFQSSASDLVAETSKSKTSIFLRDTCLGATAPDGCAPRTTLIDPETAGVRTNSFAFAPWISASGRYISFISGISMSAKLQHSVDTYLFVRDTCFGVTSSCTARTVAVAAPSNASHTAALNVDQFFPVPIISNGQVAAFSSTSPVPTAPTSGYGDVILTLTAF